jgi:hypothetical protein
MCQDLRPLSNLKIISREHALEIFRGTLPPQRSTSKGECLSASARVSSLQRSEEVQGRKMSSVRREHDFQSSPLDRFRRVMSSVYR